RRLVRRPLPTVAARRKPALGGRSAGDPYASRRLGLASLTCRDPFRGDADRRVDQEDEQDEWEAVEERGQQADRGRRGVAAAVAPEAQRCDPAEPARGERGGRTAERRRQQQER